jgi:hypothetical protein
MKSGRISGAFALTLILLTVAACGGGDDDSNRTFAPETGGGTVVEQTPTAGPTLTVPPVDRQPGEGAAVASASDSLFKETGSASAIASGLDQVSIVNMDNGKARDLPIQRSSAVLAVAAPDGSRCLVIDRSGTTAALRLYDRGGKEIASWSPKQSATPVAATPEISAAPNGKVIQAGDHIAWKRDGSAAIVSVSGVGVFLADDTLKLTEIKTAPGLTVTAVAWSPSEQSIAIGAWDGAHQSAVLTTASVQSLESPGTPVLALPEGDGRYVRSLAWGSEKVGLVFALRAASSNFSLPNDLYYLPRFGQPMKLLATAGIAAPAAVVDDVAVAQNGTTVAFTVLIPGQVGLRFHSVWVTDALAPALAQADTSGLRRVNALEWTTDGLAVAGTRRTQENGADFQIAVVERLGAEKSQQVSADRSPATPIASPVASPVPATPRD